jgi:hypothetical protein
VKSGAPQLGLSDRLNAVLVRDVQQMLNGRAFLAVLLLSLLSVAVLAALVASMPDYDSGRDAFQMVMVALAPVLTLIVPMQAFFSARQEIGGGAAELLLLSSLTPTRIVWGKLLSSAVQIVLWTSLFAPLMAFTFLLRGISVVEIGAALLLAMLFGLTMSAAGIALGTLTVFRRVAQLVNAASLLALSVGTFFFTGFLAFGLNEWSSGSTVVVTAVAWSVFCSGAALMLLMIVACSQFTHPYENRSTGFRIYLPAVSLLCAGLTLALVSKGERGESLVALATPLLGVSVVFCVFAATEGAELSPRVRALVPAQRARALLLAPLLPGHGRGLLYALLLVALLLGVYPLARWFGISSGVSRLYQGYIDAGNVLALYALFYASIAASIRRRFPEGSSRNWLARLLFAIVFVLGCALPVLIQALAQISGWTPLQILNPFWTLAELDSDASSAFPILAVLTGIALLFQIGPMVRGMREVAAASRHRREPTPQPPPSSA